MARGTNFDIVNYVHLSYANAIADKSIASGRSQAMLKKKYKSIYNNLKQSFISQVGVAPEEFVESLKKSEDALMAINQMFSCKTMQEIKEYISDEKIKKLQIGENAVNSLLATAKTHGYSELINQLYAQKNKEKSDKLINEILSAFDDINVYSEILSYINNNKQESSTNKKKQALAMTLLEKAMQNANTVKQNADKDSIFSGEFTWQEKSFDDVNKAISDFRSNMKNGIPIKISELEKIISSSKNLINTNIKGASTGEYSSAIISKALIEPIVSKVTEAINIEFQHTGTKASNQYQVEIPIAQINVNKKKGKVMNLEGGLNKIADSIQNFIAIDKKADITIKYQTPSQESHSVKVSTKRYKTSSYAVNIAEHLSIGSALAFGKHGSEIAAYYTGNSPIGAQFYNALNFYLLQSSYDVQRDSDMAKVIKTGTSSLSTSKFDNIFGGILSKFLLDVLSNLLEPESSAFIDINGMIVPTPLYYKFMIDRFFNASIKNYVSSYIYFNASGFKSRVEKSILDPSVTGAKKVTATNPRARWKTGYEYDVAALKRNILVKDAILNQKISVRSNFLELKQYREQILNIK